MSIEQLANYGYNFARTLQNYEGVNVIGGSFNKDMYGRFLVTIQLCSLDWKEIVKNHKGIHFSIQPNMLYELYHAEFVYGGTRFISVFTSDEYNEFLKQEDTR